MKAKRVDNNWSEYYKNHVWNESDWYDTEQRHCTQKSHGGVEFCPSGSIEVKIVTKWLKWVKELKSFDEAEGYCKGYNGGLFFQFNPNTDDGIDFIKQQIDLLIERMQVDDGTTSSFWLGLRRKSLGARQVFINTRGHEITFLEPFWNANDPNVFSEENCVYMKSKNTKLDGYKVLGVANCLELKFSVCVIVE